MQFSESFEEQTQTWTVRRVVGAPHSHLRLESWTSIRPSTIDGAGEGVFAERAFRKGTVLGYYTGAHVHENRRCGDDDAYLLALDNRGYVIDGNLCGNWTRKMNDAAVGVGLRRSKPGSNNVEWGSDANNEVRAARYIRKNEELTLDYGPEYWSTRRAIIRAANKDKAV
jgi:hypothetical protein